MTRLEDSKKDVSRYLGWISRNEVDIFSNLCSLGYSGFYNCTQAGLVSISIGEVRQYCDKGTETVNLMFDIYFDRVNVGLEHSNEIVYFPTDIFYNMLFCSQNVTNYKKFARNIIEHDEKIRHKRGGKIYDWPELFLALSYLILGEEEQCNYRLGQAALDKKPSGQLKGYSEIIKRYSSKGGLSCI